MRIGISAACLPALLLASCGLSGNRPESAGTATGGRYVAMGSSFAAGPGLGAPKPGTPARCMRTFANYPTLLAERLRLTLFDATCSGATTDHILGPWNELPAQIEAVTPGTEIVTVTIGGNDLNYVGGLLGASCAADGMMDIAGNTFPCPAKTVPSEADYIRLEANLREIARQVREHAPKASLVFVTYAELVPDTLCAATPITVDDAATARAIAARLAALTTKVARETRSTLVPVDELSQHHTPCDEEPWTVGVPQSDNASRSVPWHLNFAGMRAVADIVAARLAGARAR